jgi:acyl-coenzyme A synthetase/AMP-(fatty) acid ligase
MSKEFWDIFRKTSATTLSGVPYNYEILRRIGFMNMKLPSLKYLTQAGGKLNQKLVEEYAIWAKGNNIDFFVMYGQTEATARISYVPTNMTLEKGGSVGVAIPGGSLRLKDLSNDDFISEPGKDGELVYQGPNVMMGYATSLGDLSKDDELCGTLHTGDVAKKDYDGYYYITGRLKRFIKIHGNRVGLDEVESYLKSKNFDVLCSGEDNKLMLITKDNSIDVIKNTIINKYGFHYSVIEIKNVSDYPVSSAGKIKYQEIIQIFSKKSSC